MCSPWLKLMALTLERGNEKLRVEILESKALALGVFFGVQSFSFRRFFVFLESIQLLFLSLAVVLIPKAEALDSSINP